MALTGPSRAVCVGIALVIYAGYMLYTNPTRFHQTAHAGGLTMQVPSTWTPMKISGNYFPVSLRREWAPFLPSGSVMLMDQSVFDSKGGRTWTMEAARKAQTDLVALRGKVTNFSNTSTFDLKAGDRTAVCIESTLSSSRILDCSIMGTPLQFEFMGSRFAEPSAERMLASLN
jgi:hypothetical protein